MTDLGRHYLDNVIVEFGLLKKQGERAMAQLEDKDFLVTLDAESNSVAVLIKHLAGNMRSRWTDFLTSDGEKPDRFRDREFEMDAGATREQLMQWWEQGWQLVFGALEPLQAEDAMRAVIIRQEPHTVVEAVNRQLTHYATHIGQIVFLAKHLKSEHWKTLSVPRGQSEQFNQQHFERLQAKADQQQPLSRY